MSEQKEFLMKLDQLKEIGLKNGGKIKREEIEEILKMPFLDDDKWSAIYRYLALSQIFVEGEQESFKPENSLLSKEETERIKAFIYGDSTYRDVVIIDRMKRVEELAIKYEKHKVSKDDVLGEGYLGLVQAIELIGKDIESFRLENNDIMLDRFLDIVDNNIISAMEAYIDESQSTGDKLAAVLAKMNLINEAVKYLREDIGAPPTLVQLADYTMISEEELDDFLNLSEDGKGLVLRDEIKFNFNPNSLKGEE